MGNQWLENYQEKCVNTSNCYFTLKDPHEFISCLIISAKRLGQVLQLTFERPDDKMYKMGTHFAKMCKDAKFGDSGCGHKADITIYNKGHRDGDGYIFVDQYFLDIVKPITIHETIKTDTGRVTWQLNIECANIDEIDFRYFK